ncbi:MAG TPA: hypothetical protein GXX41_12950 [Thermoanaerobacterium sp.]|nr:hypothetical protein [Thermoanaerobacterium sp.]
MGENLIFTYPNIASFRQLGGLKQGQRALKTINRKYDAQDSRLLRYLLIL